jgi:hypothetical protein
MDAADITAITPSKSHDQSNNDHQCCHNCSICLSPMKTPSGSVITKCNVSINIHNNINNINLTNIN